MNPLDLPDNYSGNHHLVEVKTLSLDTLTYTAHLVIWYPGAHELMPTYCGQRNRSCEFDAAEVLEVVTKQRWAPTVGNIARCDYLGRYHGNRITACDDCLSMALCEAEMYGQRYRIVSTVNAMRALVDKQH
ncbi:hypothetical protein [Corynebacterium sp. 11A]|uniref:hypothetical protein n=1 Tax=Corynebacterium sp. 11A TaxID=2080510 RepID=UPI00124E0AA5|nr:hypothetical protein [Corynebacterium sp. 11A]